MKTLETVAARYEAAPDWNEYLASTVTNHALWVALDRMVDLPEELVDRARLAAARSNLRRILVLAEDWCGDAVNIVPWVARLAERLPGIDFKVFGRDDNPDLMDAHVTGTSRSIPVVILLDDDFREIGWWGPRPAELQAWALGPGRALPRDERYREVRRWYATDKGRSILAELAAVMERAATPA